MVEDRLGHSLGLSFLVEMIHRWAIETNDVVLAVASGFFGQDRDGLFAQRVDRHICRSNDKNLDILPSQFDERHQPRQKRTLCGGWRALNDDQPSRDVFDAGHDHSTLLWDERTIRKWLDVGIIQQRSRRHVDGRRVVQ